MDRGRKNRNYKNRRTTRNIFYNAPPQILEGIRLREALTNTTLSIDVNLLPTLAPSLNLLTPGQRQHFYTQLNGASPAKK